MGTDSIAKYLNVRTVMATLVLVIISLCGTIIVLKDGNLSSMVDAKIKAALECASVSNAQAIDKMDKEKLDISVYTADQKVILESIKRIDERNARIDENVNMLIRLQLQNKKTADIDRKANEARDRN